MTVVVETCDLTRVFRHDGVAVEAVSGVDLRVEAGEFVAVMGPSGCGKSTLLHLLGGLDGPTGGTVRLHGQRIDDRSEAARAVLRRRHIGIVFQFFNLLDDLTVADNVELPALVAGTARRSARARGRALLEALGLADCAGALPSRLSGGQQQRVALARALVNEPWVLLADEPTGNLDSVATRGVLDVLRAQHEQGQTIVLVTHDARVAATADRVLTMRDGRIVDEADLAAGAEPSRLLGRLIRLED